MRPPNPIFRRAWSVSFANVIGVGLPLELLGQVWYPGFAGYWCVAGIFWFLGVEYVAKAVGALGHSGTKTSLIFWIIDSDEHPNWATFWRCTLGLVMGLIVLWRFPVFGPQLEVPWWVIGQRELGFNDIPGIFFTTWLPYHYIRPGIRGPWEWLGAALLRLPGFKQLDRYLDG